MTLAAIFAAYLTNAQVVVDSTEMPGPGDTIRYR